MDTIEYAWIESLILMAGIEPNDVARIVITPGVAVFTCYVRLPVASGVGEQLIVHGHPTLIERAFIVHNPEDHVHEESTE